MRVRLHSASLLVFAIATSSAAIGPGATRASTLVRPDAVLVRIVAPPGAPAGDAALAIPRLPAPLAAIAASTGLRFDPEFQAPASRKGFRGVAAAARADALARALTRAGLDRDYIVHLDGRISAEAAVQQLRATPSIEMAQAITLAPVEWTPDDSLFAAQYDLYQSSRRDAHAPEAWDVTRGDSSQVIAIIDTGVMLTHPDLAPNLWTNEAEANGQAGVDDDGDGYIDDVHGWDFVALDDSLTVTGEDWRDEDPDPSDFVGHGTAVAGVAAAAANNGIGIAGGAPGARIMPLRVGFSALIQAAGLIDESAAARAILYAVANGATVINCSFSSDGEFDVSQALDVAYRMGVPVVTAAGNNGSAHGIADRPEVLSVAAIDENDQLTRFTNTGPYVDVCAAGLDIPTTIFDRDASADSAHRCTPAYTTGANGTSFSAPLAAAEVALIQSDRHAHGLPPLDPLSIVQRVEDTADDISAANPGATGYGTGRIDYQRALTDPPGSFAVALHGQPLGGPAVAPVASGPSFAVTATLEPGLERIGGDTRTIDWHVPLPAIPLGSPAIGDLGGGKGPGIFVATDLGYVCGFDAQGDALPGWPVRAGTPAYDGLLSPAVADVNGDGLLDVVWADAQGKVWVWTVTGQPLPGFPVSIGATGCLWIAVADVDGDGHDEIVVQARTGMLTVLDDDGSTHLGWPKSTGSGLAQPPLVALLGTNPRPAIIAFQGSYISAFESDGSLRWATYLGAPVAAFPAIADADGDGQPDILIGEAPSAILAVRANGTVLRTFPTFDLVGGDAMTEIVASGSGTHGIAWTSGGALKCFDSSGTALPLRPGHGDGTPTFADFFGDGREEVLVPAAREQALYISLTGRPLRSIGGWSTGRGNAGRTGNLLLPWSAVFTPAAPQRIPDLRWVESPRHLVDLTWTSPRAWRQQHVLHYDVRLSTTGLTAANFEQAQSLPGPPSPGTAGTTETMLVDGLADGVVYSIAVEGIDSLGLRGPISNIATISLPSQTIGNTSDLRVVDQSSTALILAWTTPSGTRLPTEFRLAATVGAFNAATFDTAAIRATIPAAAPGALQRVALAGAQPGASYTVGVVGVDPLGFSSAIYTVRDIALPPVVTDLRVLGRSKTALYLQWTSPGQGADPATSYDLAVANSYFTASGFDGAPLHVTARAAPPGTVETDSIPGIASDQSCWIALRVRDSAGYTSPMSNLVHSSAADPIWDLRVLARDDTSMTLTWSTSWQDPPYYDIALSSHAFASTAFDSVEYHATVVPVAGRTQLARITPLAKNRSYWASVRTRDAFGLRSPPSSIAISAQPPAVTDLHIVSRGRRIVHLAWSSPVTIGASVASYDVVVSKRALAPSELDTAGVHWSVPPQNPNPQTAVVGGLDPDIGYWIVVRARDAMGMTAPMSNPIASVLLASLATTPATDALTIWPVPARQSVSIFWNDSQAWSEPRQVSIVDLAGRLVRRLRAPAGGVPLLVWDRRTETGATAPAGIYFARLDDGVRQESRRFVLVD